MTLLVRYGALLRGTGAAPALGASLLGRLAMGTTGLALLLLVQESTGSYASAGAVAAAFAVSFAAFAPVRARSADRQGPVRVLVVCAVAHPVVLVALVVLATARAPTAAVGLAAVVAGASMPPVSGVMRALWGSLGGADRRVDLTAAYSLEAVLVELCFVGGPLLVAGLTALAGPTAAVLAAGVLVLCGGLGLAAAPAVRAVVPHEAAVRGAVGPLSSAAVRSLLLTVACVGTGFGAVEVAVVAFAEEQGARPSAGALLLAVWATGSVVGGLAYGAVSSAVPPARQVRWLVGALAVTAVLPLLATGPFLMAVLLLPYGATIAPYSACNALLLSRAAPPGTVTEAFAWSGSAIFGGAALGNVLSGLLVEQGGARLALLLTAAAGGLALAVTVSGRQVLEEV